MILVRFVNLSFPINITEIVNDKENIKKTYTKLFDFPAYSTIIGALAVNFKVTDLTQTILFYS